jgi:hypothetical protein
VDVSDPRRTGRSTSWYVWILLTALLLAVGFGLAVLRGRKMIGLSSPDLQPATSPDLVSQNPRRLQRHARPPRVTEARPSRARVPEPRVHNLHLGLRASPVRLFEAEPRDPDWAPVMESALLARFDQRLLTELGISELRVTEVECRQSSCRIELEWPRSLVDTLRESGRLKPNRTPLQLLITKHGPLASLYTRLTPRTPESPITGRGAHLLMFGPDEIDPAAYPEWANGVARSYEIRRAKH